LSNVDSIHDHNMEKVRKAAVHELYRDIDNPSQYAIVLDDGVKKITTVWLTEKTIKALFSEVVEE